MNMGYYPIQIPYILNDKFAEALNYKEERGDQQGFVICWWSMDLLSPEASEVENIIITDGCIDLVADFGSHQLGFAGMSKTDFHYRIDLPTKCLGARMKPGAFRQLTGLSAKMAMNAFLPYDEVAGVDATEDFFTQTDCEPKAAFRLLIEGLACRKHPDPMAKLFDDFADEPPETVETLCERFHYSARQCQRLFAEWFGLSPQVVLSILRFQRCLTVLTSGEAKPGDILKYAAYYDQAHFNHDFKRNIGITPFELIRAYSCAGKNVGCEK
jgi:AraC-like DNA-binding protein